MNKVKISREAKKCTKVPYRKITEPKNITEL